MQPAEREKERERKGREAEKKIERAGVINLCVSTSLPTPPGWRFRVI